jgi:hypothetical protein
MRVNMVMIVWASYVVGLLVGPYDSDGIRVVVRFTLAVVFLVALWIAWRRDRRTRAFEQRAWDEMTAAQARREEPRDV